MKNLEFLQSKLYIFFIILFLFSFLQVGKEGKKKKTCHNWPKVWPDLECVTLIEFENFGIWSSYSNIYIYIYIYILGDSEVQHYQAEIRKKILTCIVVYNLSPTCFSKEKAHPHFTSPQNSQISPRHLDLRISV